MLSAHLGPIAWLLAVTMLFRAAQNMEQTTLALLGRIVGLGTAAVGAVAAVGGVAAIAGTVVAGRARPPSVPRVLSAGLWLVASSFLVLAVAHSEWVYAAGAVLGGFGGGLAFPSLTTAVGSSRRGAGRDRALATYTLALSASLALGPLLEAAVLSWTAGAVRGTFLLFSVLPLVALVLMATEASARADTPQKVQLGGMPPAAEQSADWPSRSRRTDESPTHRPPNWNGRLRSLPHFRLALAALLVYQVPFVAIVVFGAVLAKDSYGLSPALAQLAFTAFFFTSLTIRAAVVWASPVERKWRLFVIATAITFGGIVLAAAGGGPATFYLAMVMLGVPHGLVFPLSLALVAEGVPHSALARANAAVAAVTGAVVVVTPGLLGMVAQSAGLRPMLLTTLGPMLLASVALIASRPRAGNAAAEPR